MSLWIYHWANGAVTVVDAGSRGDAIRKLGASDPSSTRLQPWPEGKPFSLTFESKGERDPFAEHHWEYVYYWGLEQASAALSVVGDAKANHVARVVQHRRKTRNEDVRGIGRQCSMCGYEGHNRRTCHRTIMQRQLEQS